MAKISSVPRSYVLPNIHVLLPTKDLEIINSCLYLGITPSLHALVKDTIARATISFVGSRRSVVSFTHRVANKCSTKDELFGLICNSY